ncbi:UNVERIFIED_CONTAM: hypothetical protein GTU68_026735 [Idotea baltica]|nr:hypothetical protein [Idotea baltica]
MKILLASSEVVPFAKTGGLADVAGALPRELEKLGHQVSVFMPGYRCTEDAGLPITLLPNELEIPVGSEVHKVRIGQSKLPDSNVDVYFVRHHDYFWRDGLYGNKKGDYTDNCERYTLFCRAVLESIREFELQPDLIHVNDWQTGLIPALLKSEYAENPSYANIATLITIHNLAYQGLFDKEKMSVTGLDPGHFNWRQMEFHGQLNFLKTGIVFSDTINTVSPTYANEIQTEKLGCGLELTLQHRSNRLSGIINGIDTDDWNPASDKHLPYQFDANFDLEVGSQGKQQCKHDLQVEARLQPRPDVPLIGIVGRLASQKGWTLILPVLKDWLQNVDAQWVILGTGDPVYHDVLTSLHRNHPDKLSLALDFSNPYAHRIEAGADLFLMPSEYEPCGLNQMYSMAYGTIPVVRRTGGLADSVIHANTETINKQVATGFSFTDYTAEALNQTLHQAIDVFHHQRSVWHQMMINGMKTDWSWGASAKKYVALYEKTIHLRSSADKS